jgi:hypothetical protein
LILFLLLSLSLPLSAASGKKVKIKGHLVDIACASEKTDDLDYMRTKHTKQCFEMPACVKSGFAILTPDNKVIRFDEKGNELAKKLIDDTQASENKDWSIEVRGRMDGETLSVNKLERQD